MNSKQLYAAFKNQFSGQIPFPVCNWNNENSDVSFGVADWLDFFTDLFLVAQDTDERKLYLRRMATTINWMHNNRDEALGEDFTTEVTIWGKGSSVRGIDGYDASPRDLNKLSPGWCRLVNMGDNFIGFRTEILADGRNGRAMVRALLAIKRHDGHLSPRYNAIIETLIQVFKYHDPAWFSNRQHTQGNLHGSIASPVVSGYFWPTTHEPGKFWSTMPGLNQQAVFLTFGIMLEELSGKSIGAMEKYDEFHTNTLPFYISNTNGRIKHLYDLRGIGKSEGYNDTGHQSIADLMFDPSYFQGNGDLPNAEYREGIIRQMLEVTHKGQGDFSITMDGKDDHGGKRNHPPASAWHTAVLWPEAGNLVPVAEMTLKNHTGKPTFAKEYGFYSRLLLAKHIHNQNTVMRNQDSDSDNQVQTDDGRPIDMVGAPVEDNEWFFVDHDSKTIHISRNALKGFTIKID